MENNEFDPDKGPTRPIPAGADIPTKPGARLRRILAASDEDTRPLIPAQGGSQTAAGARDEDQPVPPPTSESPSEEIAAQPVELQSSQESGGETPVQPSETQLPMEALKVETSSIFQELPVSAGQSQEQVSEGEAPAIPTKFEDIEPHEAAEAAAVSAESEPAKEDQHDEFTAEVESTSPAAEQESPAEVAGLEPPAAEQFAASATITAPEQAPRAEPLTAAPAEAGRPQPPESPLPLDRHPTGEPEQTGGWYGDAGWLLEPDKVEKSEEPTQPMVVLPPAVPPATVLANTVPVPVRPSRTPNLPHRVDEVDANATRVTPAAFGRPGQPRQGNPSYRSSVPPAAPPPVRNYAQAQKGRPTSRPPINKPRKKGMGCFWKGLIGVLFLGVLGIVVVMSFLIYQYFTIAAQLPSVDNLQARASQFETTRIVDRNGATIYEIINPNAGRRTYVTLDKISPYLIAATLATEDKDFYSHPGFDIVALFRALWQNYSAGVTVSGASTITQQLAKMLLLTPAEALQQTVQRKAREIILAAELTRQYSKDEILEIYLNEINYGNRSYGIEAAAESYFNTTADKLTLGQGAFLAGIPQAPSVYDIFSNPLH